MPPKGRAVEQEVKKGNASRSRVVRSSKKRIEHANHLDDIQNEFVRRTKFINGPKNKK